MAMHYICPLCHENLLIFHFGEIPKDGSPQKILDIRCVSIGTHGFSKCVITPRLQKSIGKLYWASSYNDARLEQERVIYAIKIAPILKEIDDEVLSIKERANQLSADQRARDEDIKKGQGEP